MSIARIKHLPMPKGNYASFNIGEDYPAKARALGIQGAIHVRLMVDDHGSVTSTRLLNKLGYGLDEIALKCAARLEFEPARDVDDRPVGASIVWTFDFVLPKELLAPPAPTTSSPETEAPTTSTAPVMADLEACSPRLRAPP